MDALAIDEIRQGFSHRPDGYRCLFCPATFEQGVVYPRDDQYVDARLAARHHIDEVHGGAFAALLALGRDTTGLSDVQRTVLELSWAGLSDAQIGQRLGDRTASTVRNHRFHLRRRYREAKILVALMDLLAARTDRPADERLTWHAALPVQDSRTEVTRAEAREILDRYFEDAEHTALARFPKKEKHKLVILRHLVELFEPGRRYTERDLGAILRPVFQDTAVLRRYLVDYRFMARERDGSAYWRTDSARTGAAGRD